MVPGCKRAVGDYIRIQARIPACIQLIFPTGLKQACGFLAVYTPDNNGLNAQTMDSEPPPVPNAFLSSPITRFRTTETQPTLPCFPNQPHLQLCLCSNQPHLHICCSNQPHLPICSLLSLTCKTKVRRLFALLHSQ